MADTDTAALLAVLNALCDATPPALEVPYAREGITARARVWVGTDTHAGNAQPAAVLVELTDTTGTFTRSVHDARAWAAGILERPVTWVPEGRALHALASRVALALGSVR